MKTDNVMESRAESMIEALQHLRTAYGGGRDYCRATGLSDAEIASIRINLMARYCSHVFIWRWLPVFWADTQDTLAAATISMYDTCPMEVLPGV